MMAELNWTDCLSWSLCHSFSELSISGLHQTFLQLPLQRQDHSFQMKVLDSTVASSFPNSRYMSFHFTHMVPEMEVYFLVLNKIKVIWHPQSHSKWPLCSGKDTQRGVRRCELQLLLCGCSSFCWRAMHCLAPASFSFTKYAGGESWGWSPVVLSIKDFLQGLPGIFTNLIVRWFGCWSGQKETQKLVSGGVGTWRGRKIRL